MLYTFGEDETSKLGLKEDFLSDTKLPQPVAKLEGGDRYVKVACGARHTVAITEKGHCYSWGNLHSLYTPQIFLSILFSY